MPYDRIYEQQAEICDLLADEARTGDWAAEWRLMAEEWRMAARLRANDNDDEGAAPRPPPSPAPASPFNP